LFSATLGLLAARCRAVHCGSATGLGTQDPLEVKVCKIVIKVKTLRS